jgi:Metal binding domain of Ada
VVNNIPEIEKTRKVPESVLILILILLGTVSFGLGRLSVSKPPSFPVTICDTTPTTETKATTFENKASVVSALENSQGEYVGSKNGTVYHFPWCSGAKRISEENKVWFRTKEDAEAKGYRPAANCKGL